MEWLIWLGAAVSVVGLGGLVACIVIAIKAKRSDQAEAEVRARLQRAVVLNMGALFLSVIGLMMVVIGVVLS